MSQNPNNLSSGQYPPQQQYQPHPYPQQPYVANAQPQTNYPANQPYAQQTAFVPVAPMPTGNEAVGAYPRVPVEVLYLQHYSQVTPSLVQQHVPQPKQQTGLFNKLGKGLFDVLDSTEHALRKTGGQLETWASDNVTKESRQRWGWFGLNDNLIGEFPCKIINGTKAEKGYMFVSTQNVCFASFADSNRQAIRVVIPLTCVLNVIMCETTTTVKGAPPPFKPVVSTTMTKPKGLKIFTNDNRIHLFYSFKLNFQAAFDKLSRSWSLIKMKEQHGHGQPYATLGQPSYPPQTAHGQPQMYYAPPPQNTGYPPQQQHPYPGTAQPPYGQPSMPYGQPPSSVPQGYPAPYAPHYNPQQQQPTPSGQPQSYPSVYVPGTAPQGHGQPTAPYGQPHGVATNVPAQQSSSHPTAAPVSQGQPYAPQGQPYAPTTTTTTAPKQQGMDPMAVHHQLSSSSLTPSAPPSEPTAVPTTARPITFAEMQAMQQQKH